MNFELRGVAARHPAARPDAAAALKPLNLSIRTGEHVAVIGPSGAGKTTLLQVLACSLPPLAGSLTLDGQAPWEMARKNLQRLRGSLFLAPQVPPLPPRQRVVTAVLAGRLPGMGLLASVRSLLYPDDIAAAYEALDQFDLAEKLFDRVDRLSGGERQRVGLARALVAPAKAWLIDEPLSALDPTRSRQAIATLLAGARHRGVTLVTTLHQVEVALAHFPRVVGLREGALQFDLPAAEVTQARLYKLYEQYESELSGPPPLATDLAPSTAPLPAVMHCR